MAGDVQLRGNNTQNNQSTQQNERSLPNKKNENENYEETSRGNERHILFHFFTLFSISFVCGILLIHLSLWLNSYIHTVMTRSFENEVASDSVLYDDTNRYQPSETYYSTVYTQDETIKGFFLSPFYYTGTYFNSIRRNFTIDTHANYSNSVIKFVVSKLRVGGGCLFHIVSEVVARQHDIYNRIMPEIDFLPKFPHLQRTSSDR